MRESRHCGTARARITRVAAALIVALTTGMVACSDRNPSAPDGPPLDAPPAELPAPQGIIAFEQLNGTIMTVNPDGSNLAELVNGRAPSWSADGSTLVYTARSCAKTGNCRLGPWIRTSDGAVTPLLPNDESRVGDDIDAALSVDGSRIAMIRTSESLGANQPWILSDANQLVIITLKDLSLAAVPLPKGTIPVSRPSWSPTGSRIAFTCADSGRPPPNSIGSADICFVNADGTAFLRIRTDERFEIDPAWSPDGSRVAFTRYNEIAEGSEWAFVAIMSADGGETVQYSLGEECAWSPDGTKILFWRYGGLHTMSADGTPLTQVTVGPFVRRPAWRK